MANLETNTNSTIVPPQDNNTAIVPTNVDQKNPNDKVSTVTDPKNKQASPSIKIQDQVSKKAEAQSHAIKQGSVYEYNYLQAVPIRQKPKLELEDTYRVFPSPYPGRRSCVDTVKDSARSKPLKLSDVEKDIQKYHDKQREDFEENRQFSALRDERDYYRSYFPEAELKKERLQREIHELNEQSRQIKESMIDKKHLKDDLHNETKRYENVNNKLHSMNNELEEIQKHNQDLRRKLQDSNPHQYSYIVANSNVHKPYERSNYVAYNPDDNVLPDNFDNVSRHSVESIYSTHSKKSNHNMYNVGPPTQYPQMNQSNQINESIRNSQYPQEIPQPMMNIGKGKAYNMMIQEQMEAQKIGHYPENQGFGDPTKSFHSNVSRNESYLRGSNYSNYSNKGGHGNTGMNNMMNDPNLRQEINANNRNPLLHQFNY